MPRADLSDRGHKKVKPRLCQNKSLSDCLSTSPIHSTSIEMSEVSSETAMLLISVPKQTDPAILCSAFEFTNMVMYFKYSRIQFLSLFSFIHPTCILELHFKAVSSILTTLLWELPKIAFWGRTRVLQK